MDDGDVENTMSNGGGVNVSRIFYGEDWKNQYFALYDGDWIGENHFMGDGED